MESKSDKETKAESENREDVKAHVSDSCSFTFNEEPKETVHKLLVGYKEFIKYTEGLESDKKKITYFYFVGTKNSSGISWCSDCNAAAPFIEAALKKYKDDKSDFIMVDVGDRATFKDKQNPFRLDKDVHVTDIPTLVLWKTQRRLINAQILSDDLLEMFFTEAD